MDETGRSLDVDKMVSDFLSELNTLGESLRQARAQPSGTAMREAAVVETAIMSQPAEDLQPPEDPRPTLVETRQEEQAAPSGAPNTPSYRNIDILLMDEAPPAPVEEAVEPTDFPRTCKALHDALSLRAAASAHRRRMRVVFWLAVSTGLLCLMSSLNRLF